MNSLIKSIKNTLSPFYSPSEAGFIACSLVEKFCGISKTEILLGKEPIISAGQEHLIWQAIEALKNHRPLQYVLGEAFFCGNTFEVNENVLIPRPETEELVNIVSKDLQQYGNQASILDIGTGSGCIAISLALALPHAKVSALDFSESALQVAQRNAQKMNVSIHFLQKDILQWKNEENLIWDCIVSNPPYVCESEKLHMEQNVLGYEPATALFVPDCEPLLFYRKIAQFAQKSLSNKGFLFFEINERFGAEVALLLKEMNFTAIEILQDFYGKNRFAKARKFDE